MDDEMVERVKERTVQAIKEHRQEKEIANSIKEYFDKHEP